MGVLNENHSPWETDRDVQAMRVIAGLGHLWHPSMSDIITHAVSTAYERSYPEALDALVRAGYILIEGKAYPMKELTK